MRKSVAVTIALAAIFVAPVAQAQIAQAQIAQAQNVDLLLVLAADVSRSINDNEFELQRKGYATALTDPRVLRAITGGMTGAVAISFIEWSGDGEQEVVADWTVIRDGEDAGSLAATILKAPRSFAGRTSISGAIDFAMARFAAAKPVAAKHIIDVSGDGTNNAGRPVGEARDQALGQGVTINGLAIINERPNSGYTFHTQPPGGLPNYYRENVTGGPGSFLMVVQNFTTFSDALTTKLVTEIAGTPPPAKAASLR